MNKITKTVLILLILIGVFILAGFIVPYIFGGSNIVSCSISFIVGYLGGACIMNVYYE